MSVSGGDRPPLPPRERKAGCVGVPAGPEVAIMDEEGKILPRGHTGEVVIRGANVTPGYEANPAANESAFIDPRRSSHTAPVSTCPSDFLNSHAAKSAA